MVTGDLDLDLEYLVLLNILRGDFKNHWGIWFYIEYTINKINIIIINYK